MSVDFASERLELQEWEALATLLRPAKFVEQVNLADCFERNGQGAKPALQVLAGSRHLQRLNLCGCVWIPEDAWASLSEA
eukprot:12881721-Prorocentrum_lima.AAC.1